MQISQFLRCPPQIRLSTEDLAMIIDEVSGRESVNMSAFLRIMEHSCWY
jgi:hypothetical protein